MSVESHARERVDAMLVRIPISKQKLLMELDITAVVIGYGVQREVAREIAIRVVDEVFNGG